ncbi:MULTISPECIES: glycerol dehydrogenase [Tatumella]|uniref:Glycerol dehydrogenase n=1 Tax=Tatumella punctata TaxID=399969 RepID=A0ABW1VU22_9GAMM|nr:MULTISPECIES: glycerol dehydrogenase [unclassified Tatumella]MBS0857545.1 glycerol dehydrogenase [Tatumella sp. JGM16]MBS0878373.1 glycerol dehydrogenase [Tatumella sp. JGM82]MBS0891169.1 glycerol dehydrogenase [Tatumella sp. JGM94]MBS0894803.1 glycerol dehydrogenase [Tatumella sp. JGM130]MBS0902726.1 glycerol dehydrogenase [Tatumella sp. JGM100]
MIKETKLPRTVTSPKKFFIGTGMLSKIDSFVKDFGDKALVITDEFMLPGVREQALPALQAAGLQGTAEKFNYECCRREIDRQQALARQLQANVIVGVGGGKTLDTAKAVAYYLKMPVVLFPTIASTDAPCTALAVIYTESGEFEEYLYLPQNPDVVVADTSVITAAPVRFFSAGVGDALATYFEARACYAADGLNLVLHKPSRTGLGLAELCYRLISENIDAAMAAVTHHLTTPALEQIIEATIYLSGVGAESGGLAAAHAVSNGMSVVADLHKAQHGEKVVFGLLTQLVLENAPQQEWQNVVRIIKAANLPLTLQDMGLKTFSEAEWREVARIACAPGDTMNNMPMELTADDVYNAMLAADAIAHRMKA